ncbi:c-Myc-binding protein [Boleophthalmus pectinirostris]|uniref:c-Myc-binding protein n=1 Tax=Boleophthalmus pectinirostris TaxID=150288 RepID=UPI000A1C21AE|nr:c-Myc-binding protein [Boleophthalmus pectinirostris]
MAHYHRPPDSKREQFRRYLEKGGVIDSLTSVLVNLYEQQEKPTNALEFVKQHLGAVADSSDTDSLEQELADLRQKCAQLTEENQELRAKLRHYEPEHDNGA